MAHKRLKQIFDNKSKRTMHSSIQRCCLEFYFNALRFFPFPPRSPDPIDVRILLPTLKCRNDRVSISMSVPESVTDTTNTTTSHALLDPSTNQHGTKFYVRHDTASSGAPAPTGGWDHAAAAAARGRPADVNKCSPLTSLIVSRSAARHPMPPLSLSLSNIT
ncbi:hypothetical protein E2C01_009911 [Portunus trituberculatus]|uniref:Uncharacterized protein n=1 Tax=Portunus trituberculatus TaxID=210409 RepID=A0A5B7D715_PORTR|nr:hypothetical protein [Portunus trituberculatus]